MSRIFFTKLQQSGEKPRSALAQRRLSTSIIRRSSFRCIPQLIAVGICFAAGCQRGSGTGDGAPLQIGRLHLVMPTAWHQVPPTSAMRAAQVVVPGPAGDAELAVYFFGVGQGGNVEANLQRWMNQIIPAPGTAAGRETFESGGLRITWVDAQGTLKPADMMGMGPSAPQPNTRLLGAVIEGEGGPWFLKATGPEATLAPQRDAFVTMLHTARLDAG